MPFKTKQLKKEYDHKHYMSVPEVERKERQRLTSREWRKSHKKEKKLDELDRKALDWLVRIGARI
jgi:hypothetical protein